MMKYHIRFHDSKPNPRDICDQYTVGHIQGSVATAFDMIYSAGVDGHLVGGLEASVLFYKKKKIFPRQHTDIDIEVDRPQIPLLKEGMEKYGYDLYEKVASTPILPSYFLKNLRSVHKILSLYKEINPKELDSNNVKATELRLVKRLDKTHPLRNLLSSKKNPLLDVIDIKVCDRLYDNTTDKGAIIYNNGKPLQINKKYEGPVVNVNGVDIKCRRESYLFDIAHSTGKIPYTFDLIAILAPGTSNYSKSERDAVQAVQEERRIKDEQEKKRREEIAKEKKLQEESSKPKKRRTRNTKN